jgi:hypothetical protein
MLFGVLQRLDQRPRLRRRSAVIGPGQRKCRTIKLPHLFAIADEIRPAQVRQLTGFNKAAQANPCIICFSGKSKGAARGSNSAGSTSMCRQRRQNGSDHCQKREDGGGPSHARDKLFVIAVTLFFGNGKKERTKMRGTREFTGYLRR